VIAALAGATLAVAAPAGGAWAHGGVEHEGHLSEAQLFELESETLGVEHAREHAKLRALEREGKVPADAGKALLRSSGTIFSQALAAAPADGGRWEPPFDIPVMAINAALLPTGKVLWYAYHVNPNPIAGGPDVPNTAEAWLWDPVTGQTKQVDPPLWRDPADGKMKPANIWCSGTSFLADGRVVVAGGSLAYRRGPDDPRGQTEFKGLDKVFTFDPFSETWTEQPDMADGRWYPSQARLPDGRTIILSGLDKSGRTDIYPTNKSIEMFTPSDESNLRGVGTIKQFPGVRDGGGMPGEPPEPPDGGLYPHTFWMPSGKLMLAGPDPNDSWYLKGPDPNREDDLPDPDVDLRFQSEEISDQNRQRLFGTAVLLPPALGSVSSKVMQLGGWSDSAPVADKNTASTETIDEKDIGSGWQMDPDSKSMNVPRSHANTVLLPDGSMVEVGGGHGKDQNDADGNQEQWEADPSDKAVELWNPTSGKWTIGAAQQEYRTYHSTALLLPDGRVISAGDDYNGGYDRDTAEIYEPPYLFKGPRPVISGAPELASLGSTVHVATPDPSRVAHAALIAPGATTHANDMNQRYLPVETTQGNGEVSFTVPDDKNVALPGWYMLFLVSPQGVPSVASWIRIGPQGTPAPGEIIVQQRTLPGDGTPFNFSGAPFANFGLTNGQTRSTMVLAGKYDLTQAAKPGVPLESIQCDDRSLSPSAVNAAARKATISVSPGETVRCTFTNVRPGRVTVAQRSEPAAAGAFAFGGSLGSFQLANGQTHSGAVHAGTYAVTQTGRSGYRLVSVACSDPDSSGSVAGRSATLRVSPGEAVTCTFQSRDSAGPGVRFKKLDRRRRTLSGTASDLAGVGRVDVALALKKGSRCRWWSTKRRGPARKAKSCRRPAFMKARLTGQATRRSWTLKLRRAPAPGRYTLKIRGKDGFGNATTVTKSLRVRR
jgi:hypothetical protein